MDACQTMRRFALGLLEAAEADGDVAPMTRLLAAEVEALDREAMLSISTVALTFWALSAGVDLRTAAEVIWKAAS